MESELARLIRETCDETGGELLLEPEWLRTQLLLVAEAAMRQERAAVLRYFADHPDLSRADLFGAIAEGAHP